MRFRLTSKEPLIIVKTKVNGTGPYDFAVDTGASVTVLSKQIAQKLRILGNPPIAKERCGIGGRVDALMAEVESVQVGNNEVRNVSVALMDLSNLSKCVGIPLAGIIGYSFMKDYRVIIDYPKRLISFLKTINESK